MTAISSEYFRINTQKLPTSAALYQQGEACEKHFILVSGWVALTTHLSDGECIILDIALPGSALGSAFSVGMPLPHAAYCLTPIEFCTLSPSQFQISMEKDLDFRAKVLRAVTLSKWRAYDHLITIGLRHAEQRVAHLLLELYVRLKGDIPRTIGEVIDLPLTQVHIGQSVALSGVHVNRMVRRLREEGIVSLNRQKLKVLSPKLFLVAAGYDVEGKGEARSVCPEIPEAWFHEEAKPLQPVGFEKLSLPIARQGYDTALYPTISTSCL